jgi:hypothetical protein
MNEVETFTYDGINRLIGASNAYTAEYQYDEIGNILRKNEGPDTRTLQYDFQGPLASKPTNKGPVHAPSKVNNVPYQYDTNGNLIKDELREIEYDFENRPVSIRMLENLISPTSSPSASPLP